MKLRLPALCALSCFPLGAYALQQQVCFKPSVLRVTMSDKGPLYQLDAAKKHLLFSLDEMAAMQVSCQSERVVFVVADYDVPFTYLILPAKLQISKARYFLKGPDGTAEEITFGPFYPRVPLSANVKAISR